MRRKKGSTPATKLFPNSVPGPPKQIDEFKFSMTGFNIGTSNKKESVPQRRANLSFVNKASKIQQSNSPVPMEASPHMEKTAASENSTSPSKFSLQNPQFNIGLQDSIDTKSMKGKVTSKRYVKMVRQNKTDEAPDSSISDSQSIRGSQSESPIDEVSYSGINNYVEAARKEAGAHYAAERYIESASSYSYAINAHIRGQTRTNKKDKTLCLLYSNRAAAFLMAGAYSLAALDGKDALNCIASDQDLDDFQNASKIQCRLARAYLKSGNMEQAKEEFNGSIGKTNYCYEMLSHPISSTLVESAIRTLDQTKTSAEIGLDSIRRFEKLLTAYDKSVSLNKCEDTLSFIAEMESIAPGSSDVLRFKIKFFEKSKRWDDIGRTLEKHACSVVKLEPLFILDRANSNPYPNACTLTALDPTFFDNEQSDEAILSDRAAADAVHRVPLFARSKYLRALRLEERYTQCLAVIKALESSSHYYGKYVTKERDSLRRTEKAKADGDKEYRNGNYSAAASRYSVCLKIDCGGRISDSGGRLHAILHCNRAACFMALQRFRDAAKECTLALKIHVRFMLYLN